MRPTEKSRDAEERDGATDERRRPFDRADLDSLPVASDRDPPFRPWWVID